MRSMSMGPDVEIQPSSKTESIFRLQVIRKVFTLQPGLREIKQGWLCASQILTACSVWENIFFNIVVLWLAERRRQGEIRLKNKLLCKCNRTWLQLGGDFLKGQWIQIISLEGGNLIPFLAELINYNIRLAQGGPFLEWLSEHVSLKDSSNLMGVWPFEPGHGTYICTVYTAWICGNIHKLTNALHLWQGSEAWCIFNWRSSALLCIARTTRNVSKLLFLIKEI